MPKPDTLVLFDIDGTLVDCKGLGTRSFLDAGKRVFGDAFSTSNVSFAGGVDNALVASITREMNVDCTEEKLQHFQEDYNQALKAALDTHSVALLGAQEALAAARARSDLHVGILTGNFKASAQTKLKAADLDVDVSVGAFGDDAHLRADLVPIAALRAERVLKKSFAGNEVVIIGDTPADIACAQAHGCRSIAVCTGRFSAQELCEADAIYEDMNAMLKSSWI